MPARSVVADKEHINDIILQQQHQIHSLADESERLRKERDDLLKMLQHIELNSNNTSVAVYPDDHCLVQYDSPVGADKSSSSRRSHSRSSNGSSRLNSSSSSRYSPDIVANGSLLIQAPPQRFSPSYW